MTKKSTRRDFLRTLSSTLTITIPTFTASHNAPQQSPANIIVFMSDEHNPKYSSVYGHPIVETPNMEKLAARGVVFENAYCPSPLCMPSRSAFITGQRVHTLQCYNNCNIIPMEYLTFPQVMQNQNVLTVHCGKMDVFQPTAELGFTEVLVTQDRKPPGDTYISRNPLTIRKEASDRAKGYGPNENAPKHDLHIVEEAIKWIREKGANAKIPFVMSIHICAPHFPHFAPSHLWEKYNHAADLPSYGVEQPSAQHPYAQDLREHFQTQTFTEENIRGLRQGYYACVEYVDTLLGKVIDALDDTGLTERTVLAYTSDHGEMLGKFGMWWKCSLFEDSVRVPLIIAGPGFQEKHRVSTPVDLLDLQATLFHTTQTQRPKHWIGEPLQTLQNQTAERFIFSEYHGHGTRGSGYVIRKGDWKLIWCANAPHLLFNLQDDPEELHDLSKDKRNIFRELETHLYQICHPLKEHRRAEKFIQRQLHAIHKLQETTPT